MSAPTLPGFIVIGAMRAATTTLHRYLGCHPAIGMSRRKETDFFVEELNLSRGQGWYRNLFPRGRAVCGETSPNYTKFDIFPGVPEQDPPAGARLQADLHRARSGRTRGIAFPLQREPRDRAQHAGARPAAAHDADEQLLPAARALPRALQPRRHPRPRLRRARPRAGRRPGARPAASSGCRTTGAGCEQLRANAADELARMPGWYFRLRRSRLATGLAGHLPPDAADRLRRAIARREATDPPAIHPDVIRRFGDDLADDAARFRALTGLPFPRWSV